MISGLYSEAVREHGGNLSTARNLASIVAENAFRLSKNGRIRSAIALCRWNLSFFRCPDGRGGFAQRVSHEDRRVFERERLGGACIFRFVNGGTAQACVEEKDQYFVVRCTALF